MAGRPGEAPMDDWESVSRPPAFRPTGPSEHTATRNKIIADGTTRYFGSITHRAVGGVAVPLSELSPVVPGESAGFTDPTIVAITEAYE